MSSSTSFKARLKSRTPPKVWQFLQKARHSLRKAAGRIPIVNHLLGSLLLLRLKLFRQNQIRAYFAEHKVRKLQVGAGANALPGWLNSEAFVLSSFTHSLSIADAYIYLDGCQPFPFADNSLDYVFHEHVIEHLTYQQGQFMLRECFRVLKPGGRVRIATPDLQVFVGLYGNSINDEQRKFLSEYVRFNSTLWSKDLSHVTGNHAVFVLNHNFRAWGHQFIYDYPTLSAALAAVGFAKMARQLPRQSQDPNLAGLELRSEMVGIFDALIAEATKPQPGGAG